MLPSPTADMFSGAGGGPTPVASGNAQELNAQENGTPLRPQLPQSLRPSSFASPHLRASVHSNLGEISLRCAASFQATSSAEHSLPRLPFGWRTRHERTGVVPKSEADFIFAADDGAVDSQLQQIDKAHAVTGVENRQQSTEDCWNQRMQQRLTKQHQWYLPLSTARGNPRSAESPRNIVIAINREHQVSCSKRNLKTMPPKSAAMIPRLHF